VTALQQFLHVVTRLNIKTTLCADCSNKEQICYRDPSGKNKHKDKLSTVSTVDNDIKSTEVTATGKSN